MGGSVCCIGEMSSIEMLWYPNVTTPSLPFVLNSCNGSGRVVSIADIDLFLLFRLASSSICCNWRSWSYRLQINGSALDACGFPTSMPSSPLYCSVDVNAGIERDLVLNALYLEKESMMLECLHV